MDDLNPLTLRQTVLDARREYHAGAKTLEELYAIVDLYLDACERRAKERWPDRTYRRPSRGYILRAL